MTAQCHCCGQPITADLVFRKPMPRKNHVRPYLAPAEHRFVSLLRIRPWRKDKLADQLYGDATRVRYLRNRAWHINAKLRPLGKAIRCKNDWYRLVDL